MTTWRTGRAACLAALSLAAISLGCGGSSAAPAGPTGHVIEIDIDDHGLAGLWMANAPNLKGLIARGTLAFSRVVVPTHSNQNNMTLLTGQYPDGHNVPANDWLSRDDGFMSPVYVPGAQRRATTRSGTRTRCASGATASTGAIHAAGGRSAYVGELPPFEAGADDVHLSIVGTMFETPLGPLTVDATDGEDAADRRRSTIRKPSPTATASTGRRRAGETQTHFTLRDAADFVARPTATTRCRPSCSSGTSSRSTAIRPASFGADGAQHRRRSSRTTTPASASSSRRSTDKNLLDSTNILFTLDHGKVDTHKQVALGTRGGARPPPTASSPRWSTAQGASVGARHHAATRSSTRTATR